MQSVSAGAIEIMAPITNICITPDHFKHSHYSAATDTIRTRDSHQIGDY